MTTEVVTITVDPAIRVEITVDDPTAITIAQQGPQGPVGPPGSPGSVLEFRFTQASPSLSWTVNHNLGFLPSVTVYSVGSVEVEALVTHTSTNQSVISFSSPTAGSARCF
jgi:hypothetical protein